MEALSIPTSALAAFPHTSILPVPQIKPRCSFTRHSINASMRDAEALVQSGAVLSITPKDCQSLLSTGDYKILDVRPVWEQEKAFVAGSYHVPLFIEDQDLGLVTLLKKWIHLGYIGMWMGHKLTVQNHQFLEQVQTLVPSKEQKLLVACGEGLRSMLAIDLLHTDGYTQLAWINGGFNNARDDDFGNVQGQTKLQFATIGGVSEYFLKIILLARGFATALEGLGSSKQNESI
ncbi:hypothetical protein O6H91_01G036600 [Diphasiastrum complanatum]|uniref:Uncharacterized protein n=1 Tax=Diphasiastrum complanatum TaxID=34168 RepID=A0ACC2EQ34_DIPCM|nr:hypothetical protein O6H91_01G036600 [Diphasiastrum complanatum]